MIVPAVQPERRYYIAGWGYLVWSVGYLSCGHAHLTEVTVLPNTPIDRAIPFIGWMIWPYISQFYFLWFTLWMLDVQEQLQKWLYSMVAASLFSFVFFLAFPTAFPAEMGPVTGMTGVATDFIDTLDPTSNYFPSLHVSLALLTAWALARRRRALAPLAFGWALLIVVSTLTTKRHCVADVVAGAGVAVICRLAVKRLRYGEMAMRVLSAPAFTAPTSK